MLISSIHDHHSNESLIGCVKIYSIISVSVQSPFLLYESQQSIDMVSRVADVVGSGLKDEFPKIFHIFLIDADSIDPKHTNRVLRTKVSEGETDICSSPQMKLIREKWTRLQLENLDVNFYR